MIDDCREVEANNEESVGFVQEWINTYAFLSRELLCHFVLFPVISFPFSSLRVRIPISSSTKEKKTFRSSFEFISPPDTFLREEPEK
jgi:hypothetical protein